MDTFKEGPLCGLKNGTRKYSIELRPGIVVGSLHYIDGAKVNVSFPGQRKLCYRCFKIESDCPGKGLARDCEANGGPKVLFSEYVTEFWKKINFNPSDSSAVDGLETENNIDIQVGGEFSPKQARAELVTDKLMQSKYGSVCVKWFPKKADQGDIKQFLVEQGLNSDHSSLDIKDNGQVLISGLTPEACKFLSVSITGKKFKNKKTIYCQPISLVTPEKAKASEVSSVDPTSSTSCLLPAVELNSADDYTFEPLPLSKSKLLNNCESDTGDESEPVDLTVEVHEKGLTMNDTKRRRKQKRKLQGGSPKLADFKKQDLKKTPTGKKQSS